MISDCGYRVSGGDVVEVESFFHVGVDHRRMRILPALGSVVFAGLSNFRGLPVFWCHLSVE